MRFWLLAFLTLLTTASVSESQADPAFSDSVWAQQSDDYPTDVQQENDGEFQFNNPAGNDLAELEIFDPSKYAELEQSDDDPLSEIEQDDEGDLSEIEQDEDGLSEIEQDEDGLSEIEQDEDGQSKIEQVPEIEQYLPEIEQDEDGLSEIQQDEGDLSEIEQDDEVRALLQQEEVEDEDMHAIEQDEDEVFNEIQALLQQGDDSEGDSAVAQWNNKFDGPLRVKCPPGQGLYRMISIHNNRREDRVFQFSCKKVETSIKSSSIQLLRVHHPTVRRIRKHFRRLRKRMRNNARRRHNKIRRHFQRLRKLNRARLVNVIGQYRYKLRMCRRNAYTRYRKILKYLVVLYRLATKDRYLRHTGCSWKKANKFDKPLLYSCPSNQYLAGISSRHDNKREDREWYMYCCGTPGLCTTSCKWSGYINKFDGPMKYTTKGVMTGLSSLHDNKKEDRRWKVHFCSMKKC